MGIFESVLNFFAVMTLASGKEVMDHRRDKNKEDEDNMKHEIKHRRDYDARNEDY